MYYVPTEIIRYEMKWYFFLFCSKLPNPLREEVSASKSTENSDPSTHDGRVRTFAHERGIWATYVYIACKLTVLINTA